MRFVTVAGEQVAGVMTRSAEPGRLSRGRALYRKGAVAELVIGPGEVVASVRGSQGDRYECAIGVAPVSPGTARQVNEVLESEGPDSIDRLLADGVDLCPGDIDLGYSCDCADWDEICKHVVAVMLAVADRVDLDITELFRWRDLDLESGLHLESGFRLDSGLHLDPSLDPSPKQGSGDRPEQPPEVNRQDGRAARLAELEGLLGDTAVSLPATGRSAEPAQPTEPPPLAPAMAEFFGIDQIIDSPSIDELQQADPLFADVQLGALAELAPVVTDALHTIEQRLNAHQQR